MRNCIKADILRVQRKKAFLIMLGVILLILVSGALVIKLLKMDVGAFQGVCSVTAGFSSLFIGIPVFNAVLSDDFKSKSMQVAIGHGLTRNKVIFARFFEIGILVIEAFVLVSLAMLGIGLCVGVGAGDMITCIGKCWINVLEIIVYSAISIVFVYSMQNGTFGLVMFILMASGVLSGMVALLDLIPFFSKHNISIGEYLPSGMLMKIENSALATGKRIGWLVVVLLCFVVLPLFLTMKIFQKKELDF